MTDKPQITRSMHTAFQDLGLNHIYLIHPGDVSWPLSDWSTALRFADLEKLKGGA